MKPAVRYKRASAETIRREILRAAVDIASAEGLEEVSIGRLADEMRMSKSGIFAHFGSKEERQLAAVETARGTWRRACLRAGVSSLRRRRSSTAGREWCGIGLRS